MKLSAISQQSAASKELKIQKPEQAEQSQEAPVAAADTASLTQKILPEGKGDLVNKEV